MFSTRKDINGNASALLPSASGLQSIYLSCYVQPTLYGEIEDDFQLLSAFTVSDDHLPVLNIFVV
jgi:hypothetical protein